MLNFVTSKKNKNQSITFTGNTSLCDAFNKRKELTLKSSRRIIIFDFNQNLQFNNNGSIFFNPKKNKLKKLYA